MERKVVSGMMLTLLLIGILTLAFNIQTIKAGGTIYIKADGSIDPPTANITSADYFTYYFTDNNYDSIVVERDDIEVDGAGYTLQGTGAYESRGIDLTGRSNVTIKNMEVKEFFCCIFIEDAHDITLTESTTIAFVEGTSIKLSSASDNIIHGNSIKAHTWGVCIELSSSSNNLIYGNNMWGGYGGDSS